MPLGLWNRGQGFHTTCMTGATCISSDFSHLLLKNNLSLHLDHMKTGLAPSKVMKPTSGKIKFDPQSPVRYIIARDLFLLLICQSLPSTHCCPHPSLEWSSFSSFDTIKFACYLFYRVQGLVQGRQMPHLPLLLFLLK